MVDKKSTDLVAEGNMPGAGVAKTWMDQLSRKRVPGPRTPHHITPDRSSGVDTLSVHAGTYQDPVSGDGGYCNDHLCTD